MAYARSRPIILALVFVSVAASAAAQAQSTELQLGAVYECAGNATFKIHSCASSDAAAQCDMEVNVPGKPAQRGPAPRQQIMALVPACRVQSAERTANKPPAVPAPGNGGPDGNGFRIGEEVTAANAGGWYSARIVQARGDSYLVRFNQSAEVWKQYPTELRRLGPLTDVDRARGLFALREKVQVNVDGRWVDGEITGEMGTEYNVQLVDNRTAWASAEHLRRVAVAAKPVPKPGQPPRAGLKSCAGKIEGRYATTANGIAPNVQIIFRSGKATLREVTADTQYECWMDGERIYLHAAGESTDMDMPIDINLDGTLESPLGELRKKGN